MAPSGLPGILLLAALAAACRADDPHAHHGGADRAAPPAGSTALSVDELAAFGVRVGSAGPGEVDASIALPGEIRPNADRLAHLAPRFPGVAREVRKQAGDGVRAGEVLALVESDTLAPYEVRAPFDGVLLDRHVAPGETVAPDRAAFILADLRSVWVDVAVHQQALPRVWPGRAVQVRASQGELETTATIAFLSPIVDQATRAATARVVLPNPTGAWRPGLFVTVRVADPVAASVAVPRSAIQRLDGRPVVFVVEGDRFALRPIVPGRVGRTIAEVAAGLSPGERYAIEGAFLVRAELEKDTAAHHE